MARFTPEDLRGRRSLDFDVVTAMAGRCSLISVDAFTTAEDLRAGRGRIADRVDGHRARHYLVTYRIRTLVGPAQYADETRIHLDTEVSNYPFSEPASWVLSRMPWSPHFKSGAVVCTGDHWNRNGTSLLGHQIRHHAKLLNWDEQSRGGGYVGWNGAAIAWHRKHFGARPLTPGLSYPELPADIVYGIDAEAVDVSDEFLFGTATRGGRSPASASAPDLFSPAGRRAR